MNLLERYKELQEKENSILIAYKEETNLYTIKYLHAGVDFTNKLYRDARGLTLDEDGNVIIRGFEKFFNYKQFDNKDYYNYPEEFVNQYTKVNANLNDKLTFIEKLDGSLILLSVYKDEFIAATTSSSYNDFTIRALKWFNSLDTKNEIKQYIKDNKVTLAFEYVSPFNQIVVRYEKEDYRLIGEHENETGVRSSQEKLDELAEKFKLNRPKYYKMTLGKAIKDLNILKGIEGFVLENTYGKLIKFKVEDWFKSKGETGIFFSDKITKRKIIIVINALINDELDDLIALENQNPLYKKRGILNQILKAVEKFYSEIAYYQDKTKDLPLKEIYAYLKSVNAPKQIFNPVLSERRGEVWKYKVLQGDYEVPYYQLAKIMSDYAVYYGLKVKD